MVKEFSKKKYWALVLGGSRGLGLASAKKLAQHGMNIIIVHRDPRTVLPEFNLQCEAIRNLGVKVVTYNADATVAVKQEEICKGIKKHLGKNHKIKTVLHSIAKGNVKPMNHSKAALLNNQDFTVTLNAMAVSLYDWTRLLADNGLFAADARVIAFTSEGSQKAWVNYAAVGAAKAALESIVRSISFEFAKDGIKANCIQAGVTDTQSLNRIPNSDLIKKVALKRNPSGRLTLPEDVANVVYLLSKDEAAWITGVVIPVDGGEHLS